MTSILQFGLKEETVLKLHSVFTSHPQVKQVILYGSRAKGNFRYNSDIDLTMLGTQLDLTLEFKIANQLDDLLLPYKIDLSRYQSIGNPDLLDHINRVGKVFYQRKPANKK